MPEALVIRHPWKIRFSYLLAGLGLLFILSALVYLMCGPRYISIQGVISAFTSYDASQFDHRVIIDIRLPRLLAAIIAGASLGVAGLLLQGLLRNPLAEPQILGLNSGASLALVLITALPTSITAHGAFLRPYAAAAGGFTLFFITVFFASAGRSGMTLLKVTFCGIAFSALASSLTTAILLLDEETLNSLRLWLIGDLGGIHYPALQNAIVPLVIVLCLACYIAPRLNILELGDTVATSLGISVKKLQFLIILATALAAGTAVSLVGPVGFVGLIVPNIVRQIAGNDFRRTLPLTICAGAILLILADMAARTLLLPHEIPTGIATAIVGVPVFIGLVLAVTK